MFPIISLLLLIGSFSSKKRTHDPTCNLDLLSMKPGEKTTTRFNTKGQVVNDGKKERLSSYMGTLVWSQHNVSIQVQDWNHVSKDVKEKCGPVFFTCVPTQWAKLIFVSEKFVLENLELPLILFYFKRENKTRKKTLKKWLHSFWKNVSLKIPSLGLGIRLPIGRVPLKCSTPLSLTKVSTDYVEGNVVINWLIIDT